MSLNRRQARELAFQFLYGHLAIAAPAPKAAELRHTDFELFAENFESKSDEFAWELAEGTGKNLPALDAQIGKLSTNWRIERMPRVDLTVLRLAAFEILFRPDIPKTVSINEAIELAKRFGAEDSAAFVNGLLDKIAKPS
ncbi:MAG: transcription antitermination factor NusB [Deltaproteobacteria bacterium]|nr:transcription antitermination factor NusB [Deltaproteobacteria bacterium]